MVDGLQKLISDFDRFKRAVQSLDGRLTTLSFDAHEFGSVEAAINKMERIVDEQVAPFRGNQLVSELAEKLKSAYREGIKAKSAEARARTRDGEKMLSSLPESLRQVENTVSDLKWADHHSFERHIKKLSRLLHSDELKAATDAITTGLDLEAWLQAGLLTQGGMVGSARLEWPTSIREEVGLVILLIDRFAAKDDEALQFAHTFYYNGNRFDDNLQNMAAQMLVPFARDYIDQVQKITGETEATMLPERKPSSARKVFIVHGHDEHAKEAVARFLARLHFEPIILHEQASQGRTVIEKIEAHSDVGFAVILLTPDDQGSSAGQQSQPRARQNVLLELGYFVGRLGRSRVCALKRGELEVPSDFGGVVYESFDPAGAWKTSLGRELQAAGFGIDWNEAMKP